MEGPDEAGLKELAAKLGLDWNKVCHGGAENFYRVKCDITDDDFNNILSVTFGESVPAILDTNCY